MMQNTKWKEIFYTTDKYQQIQKQLEDSDFSDSIRDEIAKRLGISVQQADRYKSFAKLLPEIQNLVRDNNVGMSSLLKIAPYHAFQQREIYSILLDALKDGFSLTRNFIEHIVEKYSEGNASWNTIKSSCNEFQKKNRKIHPPKPLVNDYNYIDTLNLSGTEFENWVANLLKASGFSCVKTTPHSYDGGKDISAQKDGIRYIFQCKKRTCTIGVKAIQEIWFAKQDSDHVAVVITNSTFSIKALEAAKKRGILCWNRKTLERMAKNASNK